LKEERLISISRSLRLWSAQHLHAEVKLKLWKQPTIQVSYLAGRVLESRSGLADLEKPKKSANNKDIYVTGWVEKRSGF
jgi:hypothetical protein